VHIPTLTAGECISEIFTLVFDGMMLLLII